jgi:hypothetical protein
VSDTVPADDTVPHIIRGPRRGLDRAAPGYVSAYCTCGVVVAAETDAAADAALEPCRAAERRRLDRLDPDRRQ